MCPDLAILLGLFSLASTANIYYVTPNVGQCLNGQLCRSLDQYINESSKYFETESTFLFLPGNHSLTTSLSIIEVSNITFKATDNGSVNIRCTGKITVDNVTGLVIEHLTFTLHLIQQEGMVTQSVLTCISTQAVKITSTVFQGGTALGGAINSTLSRITVINCHFEGNTGSDGGAIIAQKGSVLELTGNVFSRNQAARFGGAIYGEASTIILRKSNFTGNSGNLGGGALYCLQCKQLILNEYNNFHNNSLIGKYNTIGGNGGGAIGMLGGNITSQSGSTNFSTNSADRGGAVSLIGVHAEIWAGLTTFTNNTAYMLGGGLFASSSEIVMRRDVHFLFNSAASGGAMYLTLGATLVLEWFQNLITTGNRAKEFGGAIYHKDTISSIQCGNVSMVLNTILASTIPNSFLQVTKIPPLSTFCPTIDSVNDSAGKDGDFLYGGLLDRSRLKEVPNSLPYFFFTSYCNINIQPLENNTALSGLTSEPFQLMFCDESFQTTISVYRGQAFSFRIVAIGQANSVVPTTTITASVSQNARLNLNQSSQTIYENCSKITYNLYSTKDHEELTIYPDGPCESLGEASTVINVTFRPCPDAFNQSREECVCEDRLKQFNATCTIDDVSIWHYAGATFWMNASYHDNGSYAGLILSSTCPADYCESGTVAISLENPDAQCAFNRSGVLCGACASGFSLLLGGPRCGTCSNIYLLLILPFALAGIALVIFLSISRLTVAAGTINSLILYANIVQVNKEVFFASTGANFLTVFIAWMNLDLGIETCFFDGMDAFTQTCLQFVFPLYIWILISLIILGSRHSPRLSRLIGPDPIVILATLMLMSYSKILKTMTEIFFAINLEFPEEKQVTVWLKDGNLLYFQSKHSLLFILAILVLVLFFIPYTIFVLLGHILYKHPCRLPGRRYYFWLLIRIKPFFDSYHAPYKAQARFWTGLLLLLRCILNIIFSFNSLGHSTYSLLAIIISFSALWSIYWLIKGTYRHFYTNVIEISVYVNLIILSAVAATLSEASKAIAAHFLVSLVFITLIGATVYQFHLSFCKKSILWLKMMSMMPCFGHQDTDFLVEEEPLVQSIQGVSQTIVNLKDPAN